MLVSAMNPCPCGYYNHPERACVCPPGAVQKYLNKISGPLLDRIDIHIEIIPVPFEKISDKTQAEHSAAIRERVIMARKIQEERFKDIDGIYCNAQMTSKMLQKYASPDEAGLKAVENGHGAPKPFSSGLRPHSESFAHHCRFGQFRKSVAPSSCRSDKLIAIWIERTWAGG